MSMVTFRDRYQTTISNTPGTGSMTISSAVSGWKTFGAGDDGLLFDVLISDGTAWEIALGCTYTNSTTTLTRGTFSSSSTGSALSLTSAAVVSVVLLAERTIPITVTSPSAGQGILYDATNGWINQTITSLPSQTGNSGLYLTTNGTTASWSSVSAADSRISSPTFAVAPSGTASQCLAIGDGANTGSSSTGNMAIGYCAGTSYNGTTVMGGSYNMCIGGGSGMNGTSGSGNVVIGYECTALGNYGITIGYAATTNGYDSIAMGNVYANNSSINISSGGGTTTNNGISLGRNQTSIGAGAISIGTGSSYNAMEAATCLGAGYNSTDFVGEFSYTNSGAFSDYQGGANKQSLVILQAVTTSTTPQVMGIGSGAGILVDNPTNKLLIMSNSAYLFNVNVVATDTTTASTYAAWTATFGMSRTSTASTTTISTPTITNIVSQSGWSVAFTADTTNGALTITVTGPSSTVRWVAGVTLTKILSH